MTADASEILEVANLADADASNLIDFAQAYDDCARTTRNDHSTYGPDGPAYLHAQRAIEYRENAFTLRMEARRLVNDEGHEWVPTDEWGRR